MHRKTRLLAASAALIGVVSACGGTARQADPQSSVDQTPAYKRGYRIGYNAVLIGTAENCGPHSVALRKAGRLKTKTEVRDFVIGCTTGATDAVRTK